MLEFFRIVVGFIAMYYMYKALVWYVKREHKAAFCEAYQKLKAEQETYQLKKQKKFKDKQSKSRKEEEEEEEEDD